MRVAVPAFVFVAMLGSAFDARAHVTIQPTEVSAKGFKEFFVRVPTEKDQPTTAVKIAFPEGFELLRVRPVAGWKYELERDANGRVASVTWSGGRLARTEYEVFSFMARAQTPGLVKLDAYQTYGENDVVAWVNAAEPRPAPQVKVIAASGGTGASADPFAATPPEAATAQAPPLAAMSGTNMATTLSGGAFLIAIAAFAVSWRAARRPRG